jgi:hypothetical protein
MTPRDDLAHLSAEALTQLTNAGLVKRAQREIAAGCTPELAFDDAGTLDARFADGVQCQWPRGVTIANARCSCGAAGVCRHRVIAALAYREALAGAAPPAPRRPVDEVTDDDLARLLPTATLQAAERARNGGISIDIRRGSSGEPCDTARLPSATVRYWGGSAIEAARCDCVVTSACEHVALGVWAFRAAQVEAADVPIATVRLGPPGARHALDPQPFAQCVQMLLAHGVLQGSGALAQGFTDARAAAAEAAWLTLLVADLETWAEAYAQRSALYDAGDGVDLVAELGLRLSAGTLPGHAGAVLGVGQAGESALDRLRLMSLGARTRRDGNRRSTTLVLADIDTGTRMVLRHDWTVPEAREKDEARLRAAERAAPGVLLDALAHGQLLAQQAARRADGSVRLARARSSYNSVLPQPGDWATLGAPLRFASVDALRRESSAHPNAALQPRHAARRHVIFSPHRVNSVRYDANEQCLLAVLADADDQTLLVQRTHERHVPHALDAIAAALDGRHGPLRHVAGVLGWIDGMPCIEPWALGCDRMIVPDFAASDGALAAVPLGRAPDPAHDPCTQQLARLRQHLATLLHHGQRRLPPRWVREGEMLAHALAAAGLRVLSQHLQQLQHALAAPQAPLLAAAQAVLKLAALRQLHQDAVEAQRAQPDAQRDSAAA